LASHPTAERHGLSPVGPLAAGYGSRWIHLVDSPEHGRCVLKAVCRPEGVEGDELAALRAWTAAGATLPVRLLVELEPGLALLEWVDGPVVAERAPLTPDEAHWIGCRLSDLHHPSGTDGRVLLHGDLNPRNLIDSAAGIRCIDPHGTTGHPVDDIAHLAASNPAADRRTSFVAACEGYGLDPYDLADRFLAVCRAWAGGINALRAHTRYPIDDLLALLARADRSDSGAARWLRAG
jgi:hypothetical protein